LVALRFVFWVCLPAISSVGAYSIPCLAPSP
jgi:hypothetical protein